MPEPPAVPELSFQRVSRSKLAETVAQQVLREIRDKELPPGTRIPSERELMASLGVGRSTVREAINGLAMLGVLEIRHGQGAFVADAAPSNAIATALARGFTRDLFEARVLVEVHVARLAAERRTDAELAEIVQALADHEQALADGTSGVEAAVRFHVKIGEAAHSDVLASFVSSLAEVMTQHGPELEAVPGYREWEIEQHRSVLEPIAAGDPDLAAERMQAHLDAVLPHHERIGLEGPKPGDAG
jgi:GntR family transcriptional repressor for pyruvate dehydrogenase complex